MRNFSRSSSSENSSVLPSYDQPSSARKLSSAGGQVAEIPVLRHRRRAVALRQPAAVGAEDHRDMREPRRRPAERGVQQQLSRRVRDVVVAADHVGDLHQVIVDDAREVVGRQPIRAQHDEVVEHLVLERDAAAYDVLPRGLSRGAIEREADRVGAPLVLVRAPAGGVERAAATVVAWRLAALGHARAALLELLRRAEARIAAAGRQQFVRVAAGSVRGARTGSTARGVRRRPGPRPTRDRASACCRGSPPPTRRSNGRRRCPRCAGRTCRRSPRACSQL